ncbi:hypothetical protein HYH03_009055 [Edaphochlamys debaryana]|uniref:Uncharacterized protein n=1 Tax=Edaphochlamys debaryana TaxID=47281 RepID=A0A836BYV1_9CHLO|nr:hypothetical protein HYH03_009055 [Edaphochlamys debaryana]|eukprot:KAG2492639.1 hypothetical protein HYH03_009055 [Edaphochlamys debaryana]
MELSPGELAAGAGQPAPGGGAAQAQAHHTPSASAQAQQPMPQPIPQPMGAASHPSHQQQPQQHPQQQQQHPQQHPQQQQQGAYLHDMNTGGQPTVSTDAGAAPPTQTRFSFFRRRKGAAPAPSPGAPPQQPASQAFPGPHSRPMVQVMEPDPANLPPVDHQPVHEIIGSNWIFLAFVPYFVATALQDTHLQLGLIIACASAGGILIAGFMAKVLNWRKVFPYIAEVIMVIIYAVLLGVSYGKEAWKNEIQRTYNFIVHSALSGTFLLSMCVCHPAGYQHAQEGVHRLYMTAGEVHRAGMYATAVLVVSLVSSCLLYLVPVCLGVEDRHWNGWNLAFRLIYPPVATFVGLLAVRLLPPALLPNLAVVHGLNRKAPARLPPYLTDLMSLKPPSILDATMYQSTADAATKAREGAAMRGWGAGGPPGPPGGRTPRYAPAPNVPPYMASPPRAHAYHPVRPSYGSDGGYGPGMGPQAYGKGLSAPPGALIPGDQAAEAYAAGSGMQPHHALYTYYAAGPPSPPPLAVYAVYGDNNAQPYGGAPPGPYGGLPPPYGPGGPGAGPGGMGPANPLRPRMEPLVYGGNSRVTPVSPGMSPGAAAQGRIAAGYNPMGRRMGPYEQPVPPLNMANMVPPHDMAAGGPMPPYSYGPYGMVPGRPYASTGGAGPYGVNMPLGAMAGREGGGWGAAPPTPPRQQASGASVGLAPSVYGQQQPRYSGQSYNGPYGGRGQQGPQPGPALPGPRYGSDGGRGYGLGAEVGLPSRGGSVANSLAGSLRAPLGGYNRPPPAAAPPPPLLPQAGGGYGSGGGYGLDAEVRSGPATPTYSLPPPPVGVTAAPTAQMRGPGGGGGGGFGLAAEVGGGGPTSLGGSLRGPSPLGQQARGAPSRFGAAPAGGGGGYGLDAEVRGAY